MRRLALILALALAPAALAQDEAFPLYPDPGLPRAPAPENVTPPEAEQPAEQVVVGLSSDSVAITASFDGSEILIYGAIRRETPIPDTPLHVIITVEAPSQALTIWRKARRAGIWVNTERVDVGAVPSYYAVASTGPLDQILDPAWDARYRISLPQAMRAFEGALEVRDTVPFTEALLRLREAEGRFLLDENGVHLAEETLFRADIALPATLVEGEYKTRIFLVREGQVIDVHRAPIMVRKIGLERWLYRLAFDQPLLYGLMSLAVAVLAGWGASAAFRKLRRA